MTATLDQQITDLADLYGLDHIALQLFTLDDGERFLGVNVHANRIVGSSKGRGKSLTDCFKEALLDLRAKQLIAVPELAPLGAAA